MKNKGKQSGSQSLWLCAAALIAAIMLNVLMITGCDDGSGGGGGGGGGSGGDPDIPPEDKPVKDRWWKWVAPNATAT